MKLTIIGAAGLRTPLLVQALIKRQAELHLEELALMDIDDERLELISALITALDETHKARFPITYTTDARQALQRADYVITTFRVGGMEGRVIDERVPLSLGLLGQETTGAGGFAMAMRTIPVLTEYLNMMAELCPNAWLINFANPSGLLTEMVLGSFGWKRAVGICDAPATMQRAAASLLGVSTQEIFLDYFGLNHLGWIRGVHFKGENILPKFLEGIRAAGGIAELPFDAALLSELGMIPNEYLYYYYYTRQAVQRIQTHGETRGEWLCRQNQAFFSELKQSLAQENPSEMLNMYRKYIHMRGISYMKNEAGVGKAGVGLSLASVEDLTTTGYAGVALDVIEGLCGGIPKIMTLNVQNRGAIEGMDEQDVVEVPAVLANGEILPLAVGNIPTHCLGLMKQVKEYEKLTITAAIDHSYSKAVQALALHPLVGDYYLAQQVLEGYQKGHGQYFPALE